VLVGPKGQKLVLSKQVVNLRQNPYLRGLITYPTLPVVGEGTYTANIMVQSGRGWKRAGQASFEVTFGKVALAEIPAGGSRRLQ
jgi:hypothetical protein